MMRYLFFAIITVGLAFAQEKESAQPAEKVIAEYEVFDAQYSNVKVIDLWSGGVTIRTLAGDDKKLNYAEVPVHVRHDLGVVNAVEAKENIEKQKLQEQEAQLMKNVKPRLTDEELLSLLGKKTFVITKGEVINTTEGVAEVKLRQMTREHDKVQKVIDKVGPKANPEIFKPENAIRFYPLNEPALLKTNDGVFNTLAKGKRLDLIFAYDLGEKDILFQDGLDKSVRLLFTDEKEALDVLRNEDETRYQRELYEVRKKLAPKKRENKPKVDFSDAPNEENLSEQEKMLLKGKFTVVNGRVEKVLEDGLIVKVSKFTREHRKIDAIIKSGVNNIEREITDPSYRIKFNSSSEIVFISDGIAGLKKGEKIGVKTVYDLGVRKSVDHDGYKKSVRVLFLNSASALASVEEEKVAAANAEALKKQEAEREKEEARLLAEQKKLEEWLQGIKDMPLEKKLEETRDYRFVITAAKVLQSYEDGVLVRVNEYSQDDQKIEAVRKSDFEADFHDPAHGIKFERVDALLFIPIPNHGLKFGDLLDVPTLHEMGGFEVVYNLGDVKEMKYGKKVVEVIKPAYNLDDVLVRLFEKRIAEDKAKEDAQKVIEKIK